MTTRTRDAIANRLAQNIHHAAGNRESLVADLDPRDISDFLRIIQVLGVDPDRLTEGVAENAVGVDDIAKMLKKSPFTIRQYARNGDIPAHKIGREWKFFRSEIREHLTNKVLDPWGTR